MWGITVGAVRDTTVVRGALLLCRGIKGALLLCREHLLCDGTYCFCVKALMRNSYFVHATKKSAIISYCCRFCCRIPADL